METEIRSYSVDYRKDVWSEIVERFRNNISPNGVIYFKGDYDRGAESAFTKYCEDRGLKFIRKTFLEYSGKGPLQHLFYYLAVRDTREYEQGFIRFNCDGAGKGTCWYKAEQIHKVTVTPSMAKIIERTDIAVKNYPIFPRVYLITRRLKELMEPLRFSGIAMTPCLESGKQYSSDEIAFLSRDERLEKESRVFQLSIIGRTFGKPSIGNLIAAGGCPRCGALSIIDGDRTMTFRTADLGDEDFQSFGEVLTENKGKQHMLGQIPIISARVLRFFIENKIDGLKHYLNDPPIRHAVVQTHD